MAKPKQMIREHDKALIKRIFRDAESIESAEEIAKVWDNRQRIISNIVWDQVAGQITGEMGYTYEDGGEMCFKELGNIRSCLWWNSATYDIFALGYTPSNGEFTEKIRDSLKETLSLKLPDSWFEDDLCKNDCVDRWFNIGLYQKPPEQAAGYLIDRLKALEEAAKDMQG